VKRRHTTHETGGDFVFGQSSSSSIETYRRTYEEERAPYVRRASLRLSRVRKTKTPRVSTDARPFNFKRRLGRVMRKTDIRPIGDFSLKSETEKPRARFSRERDRQIREGGFEETREGSERGCVNDETTVQRRATKGPHGISRRVSSVLNLGLGVCRGARASLPYLPGIPREMTAHLLPYTACAARISLSSSSVNGPRFTVGLSWLHHLRVFRRNNENGNKSERLVRKGEGTRGDARGWGGSAFEDQARKRASRAARDHRRRARRAHGDSRGVARPRMRSGARAP